MIYARINLEKTDYQVLTNWKYISNPDYLQLNQIYLKYCQYKKFSSVMPLFPSEFFDVNNDVLGYYDHNELVAFSLMKRFDNSNVEAIQFAWTYHKPQSRLGIESLKNECAIYKNRGFKYLYLGGADEYKKQIDGFEILGPI